MLDVIVEHPVYGQLTGQLQISSRYGAAIWSRLQGEYTVLPFYGEDIRKLKRAMR